MYFPFLRGKQNELLAIRECVEKLESINSVVPIIEPVNKGFSPLLTCLNALSKKNVEHIIVFNPSCGELGKSPSLSSDLMETIKTETSSNHFAFILNSSTKSSDISDFISKIGNRKFSFIHQTAFSDPAFLFNISANLNFSYHIFIDTKVSRGYKEQFTDFKRVEIKSCFREVGKNAEYLTPNHEFYTDAHLTYSKDRLFGFGDYTILPEKFKSGGFQPYVAALHLTHEIEDTYEVWVRHFLSEIYDYPTADQAKLIHEALPEMIDFIMEYKDYFKFSDAVKELIQIHETGKSTNLGYMKKLAIKHHLELFVKIMK